MQIIQFLHCKSTTKTGKLHSLHAKNLPILVEKKGVIEIFVFDNATCTTQANLEKCLITFLAVSMLKTLNRLATQDLFPFLVILFLS